MKAYAHLENRLHNQISEWQMFPDVLFSNWRCYINITIYEKASPGGDSYLKKVWDLSFGEVILRVVVFILVGYPEQRL